MRRTRMCIAAAGVVAAMTAVSGCTFGAGEPSTPTTPPLSTERPGYGNPPADAVATVTDERVEAAVAALPASIEQLMDETGMPGLAVAVVYGGKLIYSEGFGVRNIDSGEPVDPDTVFQLASVSKSVGATVVAHEVTEGVVDWDTPVALHLPEFALADPWVTEHVTIGDLYAHRSGLFMHAGDELEDLGYDRGEVLQRLRYTPLSPFRSTYAYGNFDITAAAESVARAAGVDWADLSQEVLYEPLGMSSTSSRFDDFMAEGNRADGHILDDDEWVVTPSQRQPDAQSPAGGVSSSVTDMAAWMSMVLSASGPGGEANDVVSPEALVPAITAQSVSGPAALGYQRSGFYGYGFNVGSTAGGLASVTHSGAFYLGAGTTFSLLPEAGLGIIALANGSADGTSEAVAARFMDLAQFGEIRQDWFALYTALLTAETGPTGELVGESPPADAAPARALAEYAGDYVNDYFGTARVTVVGDSLELTVGPGTVVWPLDHWNGDVFVFEPFSENAALGSVSQATFDGSTLEIELLDEHGLGTFTRAAG
ncbi:serine hydrolase [Streptomyces sp. ISL-90]|nr:serine hydrolase [Streptomyces sp. ISL-90]